MNFFDNVVLVAVFMVLIGLATWVAFELTTPYKIRHKPIYVLVQDAIIAVLATGLGLLLSYFVGAVVLYLLGFRLHA